jgi:thioredoxin-related protein
MNAKRIPYLIASLAIFISCMNEPLQLKWTEGFPDDFSQHDKIVMVDFYADACSPCIKMEKETFSDKAVNHFLAKNFACYKLNNWKKENKPIQEKNRVYGIPTFIFFNAKGEEIERLMYFMDAETFLKEIERIEKGKDTYLDLKKRLKKDPDNKELILKLSEKEARIGRKGDEASQALWKKLIKISEQNSYESDYAKCNYYTGILWKYEKPDSLLFLLDQIGDYSFKLEGYKTITDYYNYKKDVENEILYGKKYTDLLFEKRTFYKGDDFEKYLRDYASRMAELDTNISDAIKKIDYLISIITPQTDSTEQAERYYAKSELCIRDSDYQQALNLIDKCLKLLPDNEYLIEKRKEIQKEVNI